MPTRLTTEILTAAVEGYESQKARIDQKIAELRAMLDGANTQTAAVSDDGVPRKRRRLSASARRRIREGQLRRWAKIPGESQAPAPAAPKPKRRRISEQGLKNIIAATKKRWRLQRAARKQESGGKGSTGKGG